MITELNSLADVAMELSRFAASLSRNESADGADIATLESFLAELEDEIEGLKTKIEEDFEELFGEEEETEEEEED